MSSILVTGAAGFIGTNFVHGWLAHEQDAVISLDALTYAGNRSNLASLDRHPRHTFIHGDICDRQHIDEVLAEHQPRALVHFAAESHVDRSIYGPEAFLRTNVDGTFTLLEAALAYWRALPSAAANAFRFVHVSTDEVYGSLGPHDAPFSEDTPYQPNSPYSASKAASDHLVRAWHHTYGLPVVTTNCSNNYGPYQFPEKLVPLVIANALDGKPLPVYGDGSNVRDWLFVEDHCEAIRLALSRGRIGESYNVGGGNERSNLDLVRSVCALLDELQPDPQGPRERLIKFVADRPGHDRRYAIDARKITHELGWRPKHTLESGLRSTARWYLEHANWTALVRSGAYRNWIDQNYAVRSGEIA